MNALALKHNEYNQATAFQAFQQNALKRIRVYNQTKIQQKEKRTLESHLKALEWENKALAAIQNNRDRNQGKMPSTGIALKRHVDEKNADIQTKTKHLEVVIASLKQDIKTGDEVRKEREKKIVQLESQLATRLEETVDKEKNLQQHRATHFKDMDGLKKQIHELTEGIKKESQRLKSTMESMQDQAGKSLKKKWVNYEKHFNDRRAKQEAFIQDLKEKNLKKIEAERLQFNNTLNQLYQQYRLKADKQDKKHLAQRNKKTEHLHCSIFLHKEVFESQWNRDIYMHDQTIKNPPKPLPFVDEDEKWQEVNRDLSKTVRDQSYERHAEFMKRHFGLRMECINRNSVFNDGQNELIHSINSYLGNFSGILP